MDECTFKPALKGSSTKNLPGEKKVKGYEQIVQRYRGAAEEKKKVQDKMDKYLN